MLVRDVVVKLSLPLSNVAAILGTPHLTCGVTIRIEADLGSISTAELGH